MQIGIGERVMGESPKERKCRRGGWNTPKALIRVNAHEI